MAKIFKNVAMAAGAGLALGLTAIGSPRRAPDVTASDILHLVPLLDRIEALEHRLEVMPELAIESRLEALQTQFSGQLEQSRREILHSCTAVIEEAVVRTISVRLEPVQQTLAEHSAALDALRERVATTDQNLQRLILAIERLVDREATAFPAAANGSFQDHLHEALRADSKPSNGLLPTLPRHPGV